MAVYDFALDEKMEIAIFGYSNFISDFQMQ